MAHSRISSSAATSDDCRIADEAFLIKFWRSTHKARGHQVHGKAASTIGRTACAHSAPVVPEPLVKSATITGK